MLFADGMKFEETFALTTSASVAEVPSVVLRPTAIFPENAEVAVVEVARM